MSFLLPRWRQSDIALEDWRVSRVMIFFVLDQLLPLLILLISV